MITNKLGNKFITIMDFSGVYEKEVFYKKEHITWIDCTDIEGTNGYCDERAETLIRKRIHTLSAKGLHFIDSGNFHYVTEFWLDKMNETFNLVVFDHHTDMQKPLFGDILSCGSWILNALEHNKFLQKVVLIGISKEQEAMIDSNRYRNRVICIDNEEIRTHQFWQKADEIQNTYPVYISIDKDVLSEDVIETTWDQGDMELTELKNILHTVITRHEVIGVDICGECPNELWKLSAIQEDNRLNENLMMFLMREKEKLNKIQIMPIV